jgi:O-antigen/teichoic acid export membrane protein
LSAGAGRQSGAHSAEPDSIARNTAYSLAAQMVTASLTAVLTVFLVRALEPHGYGVFGLSTSISVIVLIAADFGISSSTARFAAERRDRPRDVGTLYVDALKLKLVATGSVCLLLALLAAPISRAYGEPDLAWPLRAIAIATFAQSVMLMGSAIFNALGKIVIRLRVTSIEALTEVSASVVLVLLGGGAAGAAFGRAIGYGVGALIGIAFLLRLLGRPPLRPRHPPRRETVRSVGRYAGALVVVDAAHAVSSNANVLLIGGYLGTAAAGIFQAPGRLLVLVQYPGLSVANAVAPRLARRPDHEPDVRALELGLRRLISFQCVVLAPVVLWSGPIIDVILGPGYEEAADVLTALAPHAFFLGLAPLLSTSVNYLGEARRRIPIALITLALTFACAAVLIPRHGLVGAAIGTDIAYGFYTVAHLWLCRRVVRLPLVRIGWSLACGLTAAGGMGVVLMAVGTQDLTALDWLMGGAGGLAAYIGMLIFTRELTPDDIRRAARRLRRRRQPPRDVPVEVAAPKGVHEIRWHGDGVQGVFELRPADEEARSGPPVAASSPVPWGWRVPPAPTPAARTAHDRLVDGLVRTGWQPCGRGELWFAKRFRAD